MFRNSLFRSFRFYSETERFDVSIEPKQTEDQPTQFDREHLFYFSGNLGRVSVCLDLFRNSSVCFSCFDIGSTHRNKPKSFVFVFTKQTETRPKQMLFRFEQIFFCLFRGHPNRIQFLRIFSSGFILAHLSLKDVK